ncbi:MAG: hypothetical protein AAF921_11335 [Cyanobacteria bacterium P01_D01_bin.44]
MRTRSRSKNQQIIVWGGLAASWGLLATATLRGDKTDLAAYTPSESDDSSAATAVASAKRVDFSFEGSYKQVTQPEILSTPQWGYVAPSADVSQAQPVANQTPANALAISQPSIYEAPAPGTATPVALAPAPVYSSPIYAAPAPGPIYQAPELVPPPALAEAPQPRFSGQFTTHKADQIKPARQVNIDIEPTANTDFEEITISPGAGIPSTNNLTPQGQVSAPEDESTIQSESIEEAMIQSESIGEVTEVSSVDVRVEDLDIDVLPKLESALPELEPELEPASVSTELTVTSVAIADICAGGQTAASFLSEPATPQDETNSDAVATAPISYEGDINTPRFSKVKTGNFCPV